MNLLLINPNISDSVSALIRAEAQRSASPGTTIEVLTAPFGVAYIETRMEAVIGAYATLQLAAEHHARHDAVIVAAFGDPGLAGLREVLPCPVTGLSEAALLSACLLGGRFSIVAISHRITAWYRETVDHLGLGSRLASIRSLTSPLAGLARQLKDRLRVPVVDGVSSAVRQAESLVRMAPLKARAGSFSAPPVKPNAGLSTELQALLARSGVA